MHKKEPPPSSMQSKKKQKKNDFESVTQKQCGNENEKYCHWNNTSLNKKYQFRYANGYR